MHRLAALLFLAPFLFGFSTFSSYSDWQAAVGAHELETFDDVPDQGIPELGGSILLDGFAIVADGNHCTNYDVCDPSVLYSPAVSGGAFHGDIHDFPGEVSFNRFEFFEPISAIAFEVSEVEDNQLGVFAEGFSNNFSVGDGETLFIGFLLDAPISVLDFNASYQNFTVDNVRWANAQSPVPEPSGALILAMGLGIAALTRR